MNFASPLGEMDRELPRLVLLIDDDDALRNALREYLELHGVRVQVAADVRQAVDELRATEFDAVVSDIMMPGNGHTVIEYVQALQPETPVIVVTAQERNSGSAEQAFAYLTKPFAPDQFIHALHRAFTRHPHHH